ncbi:MAG: SURF1 family protein [Chloroflexales bacterium]|nr:SURF1 family protein [Chloroflexales bacterium]
MHHLLSRNWLFKHLFALVILLMFIRLGFWQLSRLEERRAHNDATIAALAQPPVTLTGAPVDPDNLHFRNVQVTGTYDNAASVVLRNQTLEGVPGLHLLTPLRIVGSDQAIIVDRGWIPEDQRQPEDLAAYAIDGEVTVEGIAFRAQTRPDALLAPMDLPLPNETRIDAWMRVDIAKMQQQMPDPLLPIFVEQAADPAAPLDILPRPEPLAALDEGPHLGYAIQWFTFTGILIIVYTVLIRQELKRNSASPPTAPGQSRLSANK